VVRDGVSLLEVKCDTGANATATVEFFCAPGFDAVPLAGDSLALLPVSSRLGGFVGVAQLDPKNVGQAGPGEQQLYGRAPDGSPVCSVWTKGDGSVVVSNGGGAITLESGGTIDLNGFRIDPTGNVTAPGDITSATGTIEGATIKGTTVEGTTSLIVGALEVSTHVHISAIPGSPSGPPIGPPPP
jgi:hypothetical protein